MLKFYLIGLLSFYFLPFRADAINDNRTSFCKRDCTMEYNFFRKYSQQGSSLATYSMAIMNFKGHGREKNIPLANRQLLKAARYGEPAAMYQLAYNYLYGLHRKRDLEKAHLWFSRLDKFKTLDSKRFSTLLNRILSNEHTNTYTSVESVFNKIKVIEVEQPIFHVKESSTNIERITISLEFSWSFVLYNAKLQTCYINCTVGASHALIPLIRVVNEQEILKELESI